MIIDDLGDAQDVEKLVDINVMVLFKIYPETVVQRSNCEDVLINIGDEIGGLNGKLFWKLVHGRDFFGFEIQFEYEFLLSEYYGCEILSWLRIFKYVLHTNFIEYGHIFQNNPLVQ